MLNKVQLIGRLVRDVELRHTQAGKAVANVTLAVNRRSGEKEDVAYVDITLWEKRAEAFAEFHARGELAYVEGYLVMDRWTDEETKKERTKLKVTVTNWEFISSVLGRSLDKKDEGKEPAF